MASKDKKLFVCSACGAESGKWLGKCTACGEWDTLAEKAVVPAAKGVIARRGYAGASPAGLMPLDDVESEALVRIPTGMAEFDRMLGFSAGPGGVRASGLVEGSVVTLGGHAGAGKSTLLLQTGCVMAQTMKVAYFSGEESREQIKDRKERLNLGRDGLLIATETNVVAIGAMLEREAPAVAIIDSIQTMYHPEIDSMAGGASQVKGSAAYLTQIAKQHGIAMILVGHMIKADAIAGPEALRHIVDAVLILSSTEDARYRILRAEKNRFGDTSEIGVFAMTPVGLKVVENPSAIFLSRAIDDVPGSVVTPLWEGSRPMLVEVQALVDASLGGNPRRVSVGLDDKRLAMLLAILNKHSGLVVADKDVYANVVGGIKVAGTETSADLPILLAAASSIVGKVIPADVMAFGELGLSGEVRPCANGQDRIREAAKLGFKRAVVPIGNLTRDMVAGIDVYPVTTLAQAMEWLQNL